MKSAHAPLHRLKPASQVNVHAPFTHAACAFATLVEHVSPCLLYTSLIGRRKWLVLPNTAGCYTADEAVRTLRLARELEIAPPPTEAHTGPMVKLEVIGDAETLYPDNEQTLVAARELVKEGFVVLPYCCLLYTSRALRARCSRAACPREARVDRRDHGDGDPRPRALRPFVPRPVALAA